MGTDANGYNFGPEMLAATEDGRWVSYVYRNPESAAASAPTTRRALKNAWVVKHDGLLFGSGWYVNADEFTRSLVAAAVNKFRSAGLEATIAYFTGPESVYSGLAATIDYYNSAETVGTGMVRVHSRQQRHDRRPLRQNTGGNGPQGPARARICSRFNAEGHWVTTEDVRVWVAGYDGMTFGSGWRSESRRIGEVRPGR